MIETKPRHNREEQAVRMKTEREIVEHKMGRNGQAK